MKIRVVEARELGSSEWLRWSNLQSLNPTLASPFFRPEFTSAIAQAQPGVYIGILESRESIDGFFPFQSSEAGFGVPVGSRLSDYHGVIGSEELIFDAGDLIDGCRLRNWKFDHLPAAQKVFAPYVKSRSQSPQIDLSNGFEAFVRHRPQAGARPFRRLSDLRRQITREIGPLCFQFSNQDRADLNTLFRLKSEQYARTKSPPLFQLPGVRDALDALWSTAGAGFSPVLSTLHAGDTLIAAHLGLRSRETLHWWFPVYEPRFAPYSPGLQLLLFLAEHASSVGVLIIDLGKGDERYKRRFANASNEVLQGYVERPDIISNASRVLSVMRGLAEKWRSGRRERLVVLTPALAKLRNTWDAFGADDPLWAICMRPDRKYQAWHLEEFMASGESEISADLENLKAVGVVLNTGSALDFGCGIGRITRALTHRFDRVVGVDVSPRLIAEARRLDSGSRRAVFHEQTREDLSVFPDESFDFIYCCNVLQCMPKQLGLQYLREFMRVAATGGVVFFQVPVEFRDLPFQLPPDAYCADLSITLPDSPLSAGQSATVLITVRNASPRRWPASFCDGRSQDLRVGNHWLDSLGHVVAADDGRAHLPKPLRPGDSVVVPLKITAPSAPGRYVLQADLVVEGVAWFGSRGSQVASLRVDVSAARLRRDQQVSAVPEPLMATHVIPREMIERVIREAGGQIVDVREDSRAGPVWKGLQFTVVKRARGSQTD